MTVRVHDPWALSLAGLLATAGVAHFVAPERFVGIVPSQLPGSGELWTSVSGAAEIGLAIGLSWPATRRKAATLTAIFFVAVFPANVKMAIDWASRPTPEFVIALLRLPLQIPLIWWAWHIRRRSSRPQLAR